MDNNWFKIWPSKLRSLVSSLPTGRMRADMTLLIVTYLDDGGLPDSDPKLAFLTGLPIEDIQALRPYFEFLGRCEGGRLYIDFAEDVIEDTDCYQAYITSLRGDWPAIRLQILERDDWKCQYCGDEATAVDHVIARSRGGTNEWENLVAACKPCNSKKGNRTPEEAGMRLIRKAVI